MQVFNIVDNVSEVNFGIWNAAISTAEYLSEMGVKSFIIHPENENFICPDYVTSISLNKEEMNNPTFIIDNYIHNIESDIIVSHGCWQYPTKWGHYLSKRNYKWIYVPHGMLEPWPMKQKYLKKLLYFNLFERRYAKHAKIIRAVSMPELKNLLSFFPLSNIKCISNGVKVNDVYNKDIREDRKIYVFLARLHKKKGIVELVEGWLRSNLCNDNRYLLKIVGPDQDLLHQLTSLINSSSNIEYTGPLFGMVKEKVLRSASFFVLPSYSEGLPTTVLEAMTYGAIPLISSFSNLPDILAQDFSVTMDPTIKQVKNVLELTAQWPAQKIEKYSREAFNYVKEKYSIYSIAEQQFSLYNDLINAGK